MASLIYLTLQIRQNTSRQKRVPFAALARCRSFPNSQHPILPYVFGKNTRLRGSRPRLRSRKTPLCEINRSPITDSSRFLRRQIDTMSPSMLARTLYMNLCEMGSVNKFFRPLLSRKLLVLVDMDYTLSDCGVAPSGSIA